MEKRIYSKRTPSLTSSSDITGTDSSISYENTEDEIGTNSPTSLITIMDPIKAAMKPENMLEKFVEVGGRRYFNDVAVKGYYYMPSDQKEVERTYVRNHLDKIMWGGNYSAPVFDNLSLGASVLDVG